LVGNEGNFTNGNASISRINLDSGTVEQQVFQQRNNRPLGDVLQTLYQQGDSIFAIINNSNRIEIMDAGSLELLGTIRDLVSPRYLLPIGDGEAYVSDFQSDVISIIDLASAQKTGEIKLPGWTEGMQQIGKEVFVCNRYREYIYILNTIQDEVVDSIRVAYGSGAITEDADGALWVYCVGDVIEDRPGGLYRIDPESRAITYELELRNPEELYPRLAFNSARDTLYYLRDGIRRLTISDPGGSEVEFLPEGQRNYYGLSVDPETSTVYTADARDFVQRGVIIAYWPNGAQIWQREVGIIPGSFLFTE